MIYILHYSLFFVSLFFVFFILYSIARNDFVMLRRGVDLSTIFDGAFVSGVVGFVFSRVFFIIDTFSFNLFNPLLFFHLFYHPGMSIMGFFVGLVIAVLFLFRKKNALRRAYDVYFLGFFPIFLYFLLLLILQSTSTTFLITFIAHAFVSAVLFAILFYSHRNFSLQDGSVALLMVEYIFLSAFGYHFLIDVQRFYFFSWTQYFSLLVIVVGTVLFLINQKKIKVKVIRR